MKSFSAIVVCLLTAHAALAQLPPPIEQAVAPQSSAGIHPAVVRVVAPGDGSISFGSGTLVYVGENHGLVVTNWHVINEATGPISVHFPDGFYSLATPQKVDRDWDLALLAIHKPQVAPVPLAEVAPHPGDLLTIAGYGSGTYRAVSGPCTQYVAPGVTFPFEMLEVAVSAQSGGLGWTHPQQPWRTGRRAVRRRKRPHVRQLLWPRAVVLGERRPAVSGHAADRDGAAGPDRRAPPADASTQSSRQEPGHIDQQVTSRQLPSDVAFPVLTTSMSTSRQVSPAAEPAPAPVVASTRADAAALPQAQVIGWEDLAGDTLGAQIKSVLAAIGVLAMILHVLKWMSSEPANA